ncbi:MAG: hypothetical protein KC492_25550, partial [Myxococcales bacterium]|nr:hypothetical protein [Myxococcales bacterium]
VESTLFEGIDHPVRTKRGATTVYFELDLASNVRRLRAAGGADLGGYRYSAFGRELEDTASVSFDQDLRWKGRPRDVLGASLETYDMRAREWVPEMGGFGSVDELAFWDVRTTLWGWPAQSTLRFADPFGRGESGGGGSTDDWSSPLPCPEPSAKCTCFCKNGGPFRASSCAKCSDPGYCGPGNVENCKCK